MTKRTAVSLSSETYCMSLQVPVAILQNNFYIKVYLHVLWSTNTYVKTYFLCLQRKIHLIQIASSDDTEWIRCIVGNVGAKAVGWCSVAHL